MQFIINFIFIILVVILQISVIPILSVYSGTMNLILLVMLSLVFIGRSREAAWWAGLGGIMLDLNSPLSFGLYTVTFLGLYFSYYLITKRYFASPPLWLGAFFILLASIVMDLPFAILTSNYFTIVPDFIYNTLVGFIVFWLVGKYFKPKDAIGMF